LKDIFQIVNVDVSPYPNYIKTVPCILINNQVVAGDRVFEYFGKIVESKMAQEERDQEGKLQEKDQGVCKINDDGELEGYCGDSGVGIGFSTISEENDDYQKKRHSMDTNLDFLDGSDDSNTVYQQLKQMEAGDEKLGQKRQNFDSDYERMQSERGELLNSQKGDGPMRR